VSVNSEVPSFHLALQHALLGKPVNMLPPNTLHYNIMISWDHCSKCSPLLTRMSLCGAWLYSTWQAMYV